MSPFDIWAAQRAVHNLVGIARASRAVFGALAEYMERNATEQDIWTSGPSLNQQRSFPAGTDVGNIAVAVGGYTGVSTTTSVEINVTGGGCGSPTPTATPTATF